MLTPNFNVDSLFFWKMLTPNFVIDIQFSFEKCISPNFNIDPLRLHSPIVSPVPSDKNKVCGVPTRFPPLGLFFLNDSGFKSLAKLSIFFGKWTRKFFKSLELGFVVATGLRLLHNKCAFVDKAIFGGIELIESRDGWVYKTCSTSIFFSAQLIWLALTVNIFSSHIEQEPSLYRWHHCCKFCMHKFH